MTGTTLIDTREMVVVHRAFRREFEQAPAIIRSVVADDLPRARRVGEHVQLMLDMLHHHHAGEDKLLWPKLLARVPKEVAPTVELMERQHEAIHAELERARVVLDRWRAEGSDEDREALAAAIERLTPLLVEHLSAEEERILPLAAECLTQSEWDELGEEGMGGIPKKQLPMVFGMLMKDGDREVLRAMLAHAPRVPRMVLPTVAPRIYGRYARRLQVPHPR